MDKLDKAKNVLAQYEKLKSILCDFCWYEGHIGEIIRLTEPECALLAEYLINKGCIVKEDEK